MTNYTYTFTKANNEKVTFTKEFASYMKAMNFGAEYFAKHADIVCYTMK